MPCKLIREPQRYLCASRRELWPGTRPFCLRDRPHEITFCRNSHPKSGHGEMSPVADPVTSLLQEFGSVRVAPLADVSFCCSWLLLSRQEGCFSQKSKPCSSHNSCECRRFQQPERESLQGQSQELLLLSISETPVDSLVRDSNLRRSCQDQLLLF